MMGGYIVFSLFVLLGVFGAKTDAMKSVSVMEGDSVSLNTDATKKTDEQMLWYFNNTRIALINGEPSTSCLYDGEGGKFRDRLKVDYETGSLTITNIRSEHTGRYVAELIPKQSTGSSQSLNRNSTCDSTKIIRNSLSTNDDTRKTFSVTVSDSGVSAGVVTGVVVGVLLLQLLV